MNLQVTLFRHGSLLEEVFCPDECDLGEGIEHGEDHPDVNHLDVGSRRQGLAHTNETVKGSFRFCKKIFLIHVSYLLHHQIKVQPHMNVEVFPKLKF